MPTVERTLELVDRHGVKLTLGWFVGRVFSPLEGGGQASLLTRKQPTKSTAGREENLLSVEKGLTKEQLIAKLKHLAVVSLETGGVEEAHRAADLTLLDYICDVDARDAFLSIRRRYS